MHENVEDLQKKSPVKLFPYLETSNGVVAESNAICVYLASQANNGFLGDNTWENHSAKVHQWMDFASMEIGSLNYKLLYPILGYTEPSEHEVKEANNCLKGYLTTLNAHLENKQFFVGNKMTLADVCMFVTLRWFFVLLWNKDFRAKVIPHVTKWFTEVANHPNVIKVCGKIVMCSNVQKAPKHEKPVEKPKSPKKEEAKKEKKGEGDDEDEDKPKKKQANPLDLLPPTTLVLDDFKRDFLNTTDKRAALDRFWSKYDNNGWSFWFMQYQNLPSEGKILFKTVNSASFFLQKLDTFRKYTFAVYGVYGVEGDYVCRGVFMWRGTEIPQEVNITYLFFR